jgi:uncharacterized protein (AIM24 family)
MVAITTHYDPLTLQVTKERPYHRSKCHGCMVRESATGLRTDISLKTFVGRSSGESFQMAFTGKDLW